MTISRASTDPKRSRPSGPRPGLGWRCRGPAIARSPRARTARRPAPDLGLRRRRHADEGVHRLSQHRRQLQAPSSHVISSCNKGCLWFIFVCKTTRVCLAGVRVAASWFVALLVSALRYADEYYPVASGRSAPAIRGGLNLPEGDEPDDWNLLPFSIIIGVAAQTADISFGARTLRRVGTVHSFLAFAFNTIVVALTINLWAATS